MAAPIRGTAKAVLFVVAYRDGTARGCTASVARLASDSGVGVKAARKALHELTDAGILTREPPPPGGRAVYRVVYPLPNRAPLPNPTHPPIGDPPLPDRVDPPSLIGEPPLPDQVDPPSPIGEGNLEGNQESNREDKQDPILDSQDEGQPNPTTPSEVWKEINRMRVAVWPDCRAADLTSKRREDLARLLKEHGPSVVLDTWQTMIADPDTLWWRQNRQGVALLNSFLIRKNFDRIYGVLENRGGEPAPLPSTEQAAQDRIDPIEVYEMTHNAYVAGIRGRLVVRDWLANLDPAVREPLLKVIRAIGRDKLTDDQPWNRKAFVAAWNGDTDGND